MLVSPLPSLGTFGSNCTTSYKFVVTLSALHFSDSRLLFFLDLTELHRIILCAVAFDAVKVVHSKISRLNKMLHHPFWRPYKNQLCFKSSCSSSNAIRHQCFYARHRALPSTLWLLLYILEDCGRKDLQNSKRFLHYLTLVRRWVSKLCLRTV